MNETTEFAILNDNLSHLCVCQQKNSMLISLFPVILLIHSINNSIGKLKKLSNLSQNTLFHLIFIFSCKSIIPSIVLILL